MSRKRTVVSVTLPPSQHGRPYHISGEASYVLLRSIDRDGKFRAAQPMEIHSPVVCNSDQYCVFHRPSGHGLRHTLMFWLASEHQMIARQCVHDNWHWDPDSLRWALSIGRRLPNPEQMPEFSSKRTIRCHVGMCCGCCAPTNRTRLLNWSTEQHRRAEEFRDRMEAEHQERLRRIAEKAEREKEKAAAAAKAARSFNASTDYAWTYTNTPWTGNGTTNNVWSA